MNPFDFRGPQFLAFYAVFAAVVIAVAHVLRRRMEDDGSAADRIADPYAIAHLRDGPMAAARAAAVSLAKRGLLAEEEGFLVPTKDAAARTTDPLERAVLRGGANGLKDTADTRPYRDALEPRRRELERRHLMPGAGDRTRRVVLALCTAPLLGGVAATKIAIALGRGRTNVGFLVLLALGACVVAALVLLRPRRTPKGERTVASLAQLLTGLAARGGSRGEKLDATELALLAAVFGASGMASLALPARHHLFFPPPPASSSSGTGCGGAASSFGSGTSCGGATSSCGSASSCSSGCGGGGGGCGGCGS